MSYEIISAIEKVIDHCEKTREKPIIYVEGGRVDAIEGDGMLARSFLVRRQMARLLTEKGIEWVRLQSLQNPLVHTPTYEEHYDSGAMVKR